MLKFERQNNSSNRGKYRQIVESYFLCSPYFVKTEKTGFRNFKNAKVKQVSVTCSIFLNRKNKKQEKKQFSEPPCSALRIIIEQPLASLRLYCVIIEQK